MSDLVKRLREISNGSKGAIFETMPTDVDRATLREAADELERLYGLREALLGEHPDVPEIWRLSWLRSAIEELKRRGPAEVDDDPDSYWEMTREVEALHDGVRSALAAAKEPG